jgi:AraC-like DNA-binding protein
MSGRIPGVSATTADLLPSSYGLSVVLLRPLAHVVARVGGDSARFLADLGIDDATASNAYVEASRVDRVMDALRAEHEEKHGDPTFGLTLARTAVTYPLGFFDHLVWSGATVRDALLRSMRFYVLLTRRSALVIDEEESQQQQHADVATVTQETAEGAPRSTVLTELAFASFVLRARQAAAGGLSIRAVRFMHDAPNAIAQKTYAEIFDAPLAFGREDDAIELDVAELDRALGTADVTAAAALEAQAVRMMEALAPPRDAFLEGVREAILRGLRQPNNGLPELARDLALSERTVQRRLRDHGTTLRDLVDDVRKEVSMRMLREGVATTAVAFEIGFARPQAFHKAFVRWTGMTPGAFRTREKL